MPAPAMNHANSSDCHMTQQETINQQETRINPGGANNETTPPKSVPAFLMLSRENFHVALSPRHHTVSRLHAIKLPTPVHA
ncbi:hypothetical protein DY000_02021423 [Brassica cretica]|uniref:Uncharacterized protein n=1 Tax=Brassica cretica TaxID=69181 RepID=A0ABQ7E3K4_BRACR|nr:hypothetical protein DY000_02021423 [Brassica cretica]